MKNVLIVDDEERLILSLEAGLEAYADQFNVTTALNGKQAVDIITKNEIDLVVTDLKMPEMDGFELLMFIYTHFPYIPSIVMTAFSTPEIEEQIKYSSTLQLIEKPIDLDELAENITQALTREVKGGNLAGISLPNFLQLIVMEEKTCLLEVRSKETAPGLIYFFNGELYAATLDDIKGEEAIYSMLAWEDVKIRFKNLPKKKIKRLIHTPLMSILMEGLKRKDDSVTEAPEEPETQTEENMSEELELDIAGDDAAETSTQQEREMDENIDRESNHIKKGEDNMGAIEQTLEKLKDVDGFMAVGIFSPNGEMAAQVNASGLKVEELGAIANDVLLKAQKATEMMDVGRGQVVHIEAPKAHVIARCLNESTDFAATTAGRAHLHMVLILNKEGNLAMAKMKLESVIQEVAPSFR